MLRREFLKFTAGLIASLAAEPLRVFVPPRPCFIHRPSGGGLMDLVSHLGVLPISNELNICEGRVLEFADWDGSGYPCLVENVCTFGAIRPRVWVYDFDLWNFRHDDNLGPMWKHPEGRMFKNHAAWHASRRFGSDVMQIAEAGQGSLIRHLAESV